MNQQKKLYKVLKNGKETVSLLIPGRFAGNKTHKIFGRLDCKSGKRMDKENRVFFLDWVDAVKSGYKPCKKCKPKFWDTYPKQEKIIEALESQPHISLWRSGPPPNRREPNRAWYACLNWKEKNGASCQFNLSDHFLYKEARAIAIACGKKYNLPVLEHSPTDFIVIWAPTKKSTVQNKKAVKKLQDNKKTTKLVVVSAFQ